MLNYYKFKEPLVNKLKRWILGVDNFVHPTIKEQFIGDINLNEESK